MTPQLHLQQFLQFGLAALIGFLLGIEREMSAKDSGGGSMGGRDFVLFAIVGAAAAFMALNYDMPWLVPAAFVAVVVLVVSLYWRDDEQGPGITTEAAAVLAFPLGTKPVAPECPEVYPSDHFGLAGVISRTPDVGRSG
ncbi:MAG: MgtC/SapB family protein [Gammaproteobacteria bacterium]|jgi:hypothetical protein|nr:MgtC/SapB family protein [Gammaproteobacteria bacterium]